MTIFRENVFNQWMNKRNNIKREKIVKEKKQTNIKCKIKSPLKEMAVIQAIQLVRELNKWR